MLYLIRKEHSRQFTMSKWADDLATAPLVVYRLTINDKNRIACSCPSGVYRSYCKHTKMLRKWIEAGMPHGVFIGEEG